MAFSLKDIIAQQVNANVGGLEIPAAVKNIQTAKIRHNTVVERSGMQQALEEFLGI